MPLPQRPLIEDDDDDGQVRQPLLGTVSTLSRRKQVRYNTTVPRDEALPASADEQDRFLTADRSGHPRPLHVRTYKRPNQRRLRSAPDAGPLIPTTVFTSRGGKVTSSCTATWYNLPELKTFLKGKGLEVLDFAEALLARYPVTTVHGPAEAAEVFYFQYGVVIWWGPSEAWGKLMLLADLKRFEVKSEETLDLEVCDYSYNHDSSVGRETLQTVTAGTDTEESESEVDRDRPPSSRSPVPAQSAESAGASAGTKAPLDLETAVRYSVIDNDHFHLADTTYHLKLAFSHALAQSAKLTTFEDRIEKVIDDARKYPEYLAEHGQVKLTQQEIAKLKGKLFIHRMDVNLHCDILDTPDFFWEHPELEPLYVQCRKYMEISKRVQILNQRLDVVHELFAMLGDELNQKAGAKLEWIVIILILIEVVVGLVSIALAFVSGKGNPIP